MDCLFCDFMEGKIYEHKKGYPFIINHETENTLSFLSLDSPVNKEAHILVIPKQHFTSFEEISDSVMHELIDHVNLVGRFYRNKKLNYNLLLNNGKHAGQTVPHTHFHVIPRKKNDKIRIEVWKRAKITPKDFVDLSNKYKKDFSSI